MKMSLQFPTLMTRFFTEHLIGQLNASQHTIKAYRDCFRLLLRFATTQLNKGPQDLLMSDVDAPFVAAFLDDLQTSRGVSDRSRNLRLMAIRSFFNYVVYEQPEYLAQIQRILAIPARRCINTQVNYLTSSEIDALLAAPDQSTWAGQRDHAWILLTIQTGVRVSELTGLTRRDVCLSAGGHIHVLGKGRKERRIPLMKETIIELKTWIAKLRLDDGQILFPNRQGNRMSNQGIQYLMKKHIATACQSCRSLHEKQVHPIRIC